MGPHSASLRGLAVLATLALIPAGAEANGFVRLRGETASALAPSRPVPVAVRRERLTFDLGPRGTSARARAEYDLEHRGPDSVELEVAFVIVGGPGDRDAARVWLDGVALPTHVNGTYELFRSRVRAWLPEHPTLEAEVRRLQAARAAGVTQPSLRRLGDALREAGVDRPMQGPIARVLGRGLEQPDARDRAALRALVRVFDPAEVAALDAVAQSDEPGGSRLDPVSGRWEPTPWRSGAADRTITWVRFGIALEPAQRATLAVEWRQRASWDAAPYVHPVRGVHYLLSPARTWASFGPLDIRIRISGDHIFAATLPFERTEDGWRALLPGLPKGELVFSVVSTAGVPIVLLQAGRFIAALLVLAALPCLLVGGLLGRWWASRARPRGLLIAAWIAASFALSFAVLRLFAHWPGHPLEGTSTMLLVAGLFGETPAVLVGATMFFARRVAR